MNNDQQEQGKEKAETPPELTEEDNIILDTIWDRIGKEDTEEKKGE